MVDRELYDELICVYNICSILQSWHLGITFQANTQFTPKQSMVDREFYDEHICVYNICSILQSWHCFIELN